MKPRHHLLPAPLLALLLAGCGAEPESPVVGTLERDRIALTAEQAEAVTAIHVAEGQTVDSGTLLLELDDRRASARYRQFEAARDRAERRLAEIRRGPRREAIDEARSRLEAAEAELEPAERALHRTSALFEQALVSESTLDDTRARRDRALGERDAARAALETLLEGATVEELDQARAGLREAEAALDHQALTRERLRVSSPRPAAVESLPVEVGETPRAGATVAVLRAIDEPPYARVHVPAAQRHRFAPGTRVELRVDGYGRFPGQVRFIAGEAAFTPYYALTEHDAGRLSYPAEIDVDAAGDVPAGVPVRVALPAERD